MARKFVSAQRAPKVEPPRSASSFNSLTFFEIPKIFRALPVRDVTRTLSPVSLSQAIVTSLSDMFALCARRRYHLHQGCTLAPSRKALSLTKPKGMNRAQRLECSPMARETWVQSQVESYQRLKKWNLIPPCLTLSIIRYGSRVKWSNPGNGVAPSPTPWCSSYRKGSLRVSLDYGR